MVLQQPQVLSDDLLGWRALEAEMPNLQPETLLKIAGGDANRIERLHVLERTFDIGDGPLAHGGNLLDGGDEISIVVEVSNDRGSDLLELFVVGL